MTTIFDNIDRELADKLSDVFAVSYRLDAAVGYFNLRGWAQLADGLNERKPEDGPAARVLVGMAVRDQHDRLMDELQAEVDDSDVEPEIDNHEARRRRAFVLRRFREQLMRGLPTSADLARLQQMKKHLESGLLEVKLFTRRPMHAKTYICHRVDEITPIVGFVGSSNLTVSGLRHQYELNVDVVDSDATKKLDRWFEDRWTDQFTLDITADLIELIDQSWAAEQAIDPYLVYLKSCWLVSEEAREGLVAYSIPERVRKHLLQFQESAVKTLGRRLERRGGAMLGDVVGLGKTITAVAVALMLREEYGYNTLVVCPPNLVKMWESYFEEFEVVGKVTPYSTAKTKLPELRRYQLVILDESHTIRSGLDVQAGQAIHDYVRENDSKVLLLTATPYNKRYLDVANQLSMYLDEDTDLGLVPSKAIELNPKIEDRVDGKIRTLAAFRLSEEPEDWRRLMSEHLIRRTRGFIRANFSETDPENGREYVTFSDGSRFYFPDRIAYPLLHQFDESDPASRMESDETLDVIDSLHLPRYRMIHYIDNAAEPTNQEQTVLEDIRRGSGHLLGFIRTSLYKRLSSSGFAFVVSLQRHLARNEMYIHAVENGFDIPVGTIAESMIDVDTDEDVEDMEVEGPSAAEQYDFLRANSPKKIRWIRSSLFDEKFLDDLRSDTEAIRGLLDEFGDIVHVDDSKVDALAKLIREKHGNEKVLVFSEFRDTAEYVYESLVDRGVTSIEVVSGDSANPTEVARRFSPQANSLLVGGGKKKVTDEIRVLISTDVLSEGQNLQDAHVVVNYDIPWAIIRLIQRAGRIDRVGQESDKVLVYSFEHEGGINAVLDLRRRIRTRLGEAAAAFGSDEQFFGTKEEVSPGGGFNVQEVDDGEVDAVTYAFQAWQEAERDHPELAAKAQALADSVFATKFAASDDAVPGSIVHARTDHGFDEFAIAPENGKVTLLTDIEALKMMSCAPETPAQPMIPGHLERVKAMVQGPLHREGIQPGQLKGIRKRVWNRLSGLLGEGSIEYERAMEALFALPLTADAEKRLKTALSTRTNDELADLVVALFVDENLVISAEHAKDPMHVACSMGVLAK